MKLIVLVGESGSGKTTACDYLEQKYGTKQIKTYTTRERRQDDDSHIWADEKDYAYHKENFDIVCETVYGKDTYWTLRSQIHPDERQSIVVDMNGLRALRETDIPLFVIHIKVNFWTRLWRMRFNLRRMNRDPEIPYIPDCTVINGNCSLEELYKRLSEVVEGYVL